MNIVERGIEYFPAGYYYIGELKSILDDQDVYEYYFYDSGDNENTIVKLHEEDEKEYLCYHHSFFSGHYNDNIGNEYLILDGQVAIVQVSSEDISSIRKSISYKIIHFDKPFKVEVEENEDEEEVLKFGHIEINLTQYKDVDLKSSVGWALSSVKYSK
ncbi:hypothetical protein ACTOJ1_001423 [Shigella flexneri]